MFASHYLIINIIITHNCYYIILKILLLFIIIKNNIYIYI
jgi:hypothetical protein